MSELLWSCGSPFATLLLVWICFRLDYLLRYRPKMRARQKQAQHLHDMEMQRQGTEFCDRMDRLLAEHFAEFPIEKR